MVFGRFRRAEEVIAFALSGGGSRGATQVGAVKALAEAGIIPHLVAGTSAGAVNAAWLAFHPNRLDRLEQIWMGLRTRDIFPGNRAQLLYNLMRGGYVHRSEACEAYLRRQLGGSRFEDASIPCAVIAVRVSDGERVVFDRGEVVPALMASIAIPGVFPPYRIGDELYVDGGVLEYLPVPTALERGATSVYAVDCSWFPQGREFGSSIVDRCSRISASAVVAQVTSLQSTRGRTVHLLRPELPDFRDGRDFGQTAELVAAGYEHTRAYLQQRLQPDSSMAASDPSDTAG